MGPHDLPRCEKTGPPTNSILLSDGTGALCPVGRQIGRVHAPSEVGVAVWPPGRSAKTYFALTYMTVVSTVLRPVQGRKKHSPPAVRGPIGALMQEHFQQLHWDW